MTVDELLSEINEHGFEQKRDPGLDDRVYVVIVDDNTDQPKFVGPFASADAATEWGTDWLDALYPAWYVEQVIHPTAHQMPFLSASIA